MFHFFGVPRKTSFSNLDDFFIGSKKIEFVVFLAIHFFYLLIDLNLFLLVEYNCSLV